MRDETDVMKMFNAYVRISLKNCSLNYIRKERRRKAHEILTSNLDGKYYTMQDDFPAQNHVLQIMDSAICIRIFRIFFLNHFIHLWAVKVRF